MSQNTYYQNDVVNNVNTTAAVARIISYFDPLYITDITAESYNLRFRPYFPQLANIAISTDEWFRSREAMFPGEKDQFDSQRFLIYKSIILQICSQNNLVFNEDALNQEDYFPVAVFLYSFFISDFSIYMMNFFTNVIIKEKKSICDYLMKMENNEKIIKNSTTALNKKLYSNNKIAIIQASMGIVLDNILAMDFNLELIFNVLNIDKKIIKSILSCISDGGDFFKYGYGAYLLHPNTRPEVINYMKINISKNFIDQDKIENLI